MNKKRVFLTLLLFLLLPSLAWAGPIEDGIDWLLELLTSGIARSVAIIAITVLGYMAWAGKLTWEKALQWMLGIVLVFGGAAIVDAFTGSIGSGT